VNVGKWIMLEKKEFFGDNGWSKVRYGLWLLNAVVILFAQWYLVVYFTSASMQDTITANNHQQLIQNKNTFELYGQFINNLSNSTNKEFPQNQPFTQFK